jgi:uncharacterized membrane protein (GlpM family)
MELVLRFLVGGIVVSLFAMIGSALRPKSFAGLVGAAPSVALATLVLTVMKRGKPYAAIEARSMIVGAIGFFAYASLVCRLLMRGKFNTLATTSLALLAWLLCAIGLQFIFFGSGS